MTNIYFSTPTDEQLSHRSGWVTLGSHHYSTSRSQVLVVQHRSTAQFRGPTVKCVELPVGPEYELQDKQVIITKNGEGVHEEVVSSLTEKVGQDFAMSTAIKVGSDGKLPRLSLDTRIKQSLSQELITEARYKLSAKRSFEITNIAEVTRRIRYSENNLTPSSSFRRLSFYPMLHEVYLDYYLYQLDYLQLEYRNSWYWWQVRETILEDSTANPVPLFRVQYYEPDDELSVAEGAFQPNVLSRDVHNIQVLDLDEPCPISLFPRFHKLRDLAEIAFPVSSEEKKKASATRAAKKAAARKVPRKVAAKRAPAKKSAARKAPAKKAATKKSLARKSAAKKAR